MEAKHPRRRRKGEGSITRKHDHPTCPPAVKVTDPATGRVRPEVPTHRCQGRYMARVDLGWQDGKRVRKTVYGKTEREVIGKLKKLTVAEATGTMVVGATVTVSQWMDRWYEDARPQLKINTRKTYVSKIENYIKPHIGHYKLDRLQPEHVRKVYSTMRRDGLSEGTLRQVHAILHRAL